MSILKIKTHVLSLIVSAQNLLNRQLTPFNSEWNLDSIDELIKMGKKQLEDGQYDDALNLFQKAILLNQYLLNRKLPPNIVIQIHQLGTSSQKWTFWSIGRISENAPLWK